MNGQKVIGLLCLLLLLLSSGASAKIVFSSVRDGVYSINVMDDDGSNQTLITESEDLRPVLPQWSPDGKQILFQRSVRINAKTVLFLMNVDGTNVRQLSENDGSLINGGRFSPDGKSIVFGRSIRINDKWKVGIYVLNIKTGMMEQISDEWSIQCDWSPDGKHIVFARGQTIGSGSTIWIMGADGHNPRPLIPNPGPGEFATYRYRPRWSPDGKQILFLQKEYKHVPIPDEGNFLVFKAFRYIICDRNGENIKHLQIPKDWDGYGGVDWMDDGKSIVFGARVGIPLDKPLWRGFVYPPCNIYKYHIWTHEITQLTDQQGLDWTVDWISDDVLSVSPHGKKKVTWGALKQ